MNKNIIAEQKNKRLIYLDVLRILAAFAVVMIHTTALYVTYIPDTEPFIEWGIYIFFNNSSRWAVPVFTMISGSLFLDNNKTLKIRIFYKKNIFRIITAYIFWILIYALYNKPNSIEDLVENAYHLWFLPMLIGLYMITPILRKITEDKKITLYFLILSILFVIIFPTLFEFELFKGFEVIYEQFTRGFCIKYSFYFIAGYYLANKNFSKKITVLVYSLGIISLLMLPVLTIYSSLNNNKFYSNFMENFSIPVIFQSIFVFILIKNICNKKHSNSKTNSKITKFIINLSKYTFGIYLVHVLILDILTDFGIIPIPCHVIISPLITNFLVFLISLLISAILNHIPILKKYIV